MVASLAANEPSALTALATICDGIAVKSPSALTLAHVRSLVDDVVVVDDGAIGEALAVTVETRGPDHRDQALADLEQRRIHGRVDKDQR